MVVSDNVPWVKLILMCFGLVMLFHVERMLVILDLEVLTLMYTK